MVNLDSNDKVLIVSVRNLRQQAANCAMYEFEDFITNFESASIFSPTSEQVISRKAFRIAKKFGAPNQAAQKLANFETNIKLTANHELVIVFVDNVYQLHLLNQIEGWRDHPAIKACYLAELWPGSLDDKMVLREPFLDFDHIFVGMSSAVPILAEKTGVSCSFLPIGVDTKLFSHRIFESDRPIDICYLGRRHPPTHEKLLALSADKNLLYVYDTAKGLTVENHRQHRKMYSDLLRKAKFSFAYPAKMNLGSYTNNAIEIGGRYYELAAAGAVILGITPDNKNFSKYFGSKNPVIDVDVDSACDVIEDLIDRPSERFDIAKRSVAESMLRNDWVHRWLVILNHFSMKPSDRAMARLAELDEKARSLLSSQQY